MEGLVEWAKLVFLDVLAVTVAHAFQNHVSVLSGPNPIQRPNMFNSWPILLRNIAIGAPVLRLLGGFRSTRVRTCHNGSSQDRCQGCVIRRFQGAGAGIHSPVASFSNAVSIVQGGRRFLGKRVCCGFYRNSRYVCGVSWFRERSRSFMATSTRCVAERQCQKELTVESTVERYGSKIEQNKRNKNSFHFGEHA
jgi:hypothetical protein